MADWVMFRFLLPEIKYEDEIVAEYLDQRARSKKDYSIVIVGEGIADGKKRGAALKVAKKINKLTGLETRETVLGYIQREENLYSLSVGHTKFAPPHRGPESSRAPPRTSRTV